MSAIHQLPELLDLVASFLQDPNPSDLIPCTLVCKAWHAVFSRRLWHTLSDPPLHLDIFLDLLPRTGHLVRSLSLTGAFGNQRQQRQIMDCMPNLEELSIVLGRSLDIHVLTSMVQAFPRLRSLSLKACYGQSLSWLQVLKDLQVLAHLEFAIHALGGIPDITVEEDGSDGEQQDQSDQEDDHGDGDDEDDGTDASTDEGIDMDDDFPPIPAFDHGLDESVALQGVDYLGELLISRAETLTSLDLEGAYLLDFELFQGLTRTIAGADTSSLTASSSFHPSTPDLLPGPTIPPLALRSLSLSQITIHRTSAVIEPLLRQCPHLRCLDLSGNIENPWDSFPWSILPQHCPQITHLDLSQLCCIDNAQLVLLIESSPGLISLKATQSNLEDRVLEAIVHQQDHGRHGIMELDVSWCGEISQAAVENLLRHCSTLEKIKFSWCSLIYSTIFIPEDHHSWACKGLEELEAQGLEWPPAETSTTKESRILEQIATLSRLQRLVLGSNATILSITTGLDHLTRLTHLKHLDLVGHEDHPLTQPELDLIANHFPNLVSFHFGLNLISPELQTWLAGKRPHLRQQEKQIYF